MLTHAPLARVVAQVRWPDLTNFSVDGAASRIAESLGSEYPLRRQENEVQVVFTQAGTTEESRGTIYRFLSADETWSLAVGANFLALETTAYTNHRDFVVRIVGGLREVLEGANVPHFSRIGYRYTNRIFGADDLAALNERFTPAVLAGHNASPENGVLVHSVTESVYRVEGAHLMVRSAQLGPNESIDPTLASVSEESWILDLDSYEEGRFSTDLGSVREQLTRLSGMGSKHFTDVVTEEFYERYNS